MIDIAHPFPFPCGNDEPSVFVFLSEGIDNLQATRHHDPITSRGFHVSWRL